MKKPLDLIVDKKSCNNCLHIDETYFPCTKCDDTFCMWKPTVEECKHRISLGKDLDEVLIYGDNTPDRIFCKKNPEWVVECDDCEHLNEKQITTPQYNNSSWLSPIEKEREWQEKQIKKIWEGYPANSPNWQILNGLIRLSCKQLNIDVDEI